VIEYRQGVLSDAIVHEATVRALYELSTDTMTAARKIWRGSSPDSQLSGAVSQLEVFVGALRTLRRVADDEAPDFASAGFGQFFATVQRYVDDEYLDRLDAYLGLLRFRGGLLMSARLGNGNVTAEHILRRP